VCSAIHTAESVQPRRNSLYSSRSPLSLLSFPSSQHDNNSNKIISREATNSSAWRGSRNDSSTSRRQVWSAQQSTQPRTFSRGETLSTLLVPLLLSPPSLPPPSLPSFPSFPAATTIATKPIISRSERQPMRESAWRGSRNGSSTSRRQDWPAQQYSMPKEDVCARIDAASDQPPIAFFLQPLNKRMALYLIYITYKSTHIIKIINKINIRAKTKLRPVRHACLRL
jgi:hypothetical protein